MSTTGQVFPEPIYESTGTPLKIKDIVKGTTARFSFYRNGNMFYTVPVTHAGLGFPVNYQFPVSLEDIGGASLFAEMKSITLMRYIRKALEDKTFTRA
jgi:hypothetical protein